MSERILIKFRATGDKRLIKSMALLAHAQAILEKNTKQAAVANGFLATAFKRNQKNATKFSMALSTMRSKMLLFSFAMSMGGRQLIEFAKSAAKIEQMETAFNTLTGATENSTVAFTKLQRATDGTMSRFDLFQQANNAMILGVSKNSTQMAEMFDIAQRLGKALGVDTKRSVESLITGIGRQSRLMLDNIGIIVKADEAYEKYAKNLKISVKDLTDQQKKQAFLNATMEAARKKVAMLGPETKTTADIFKQFNATAADLSELIGEILLPFLGYLAEGFIQLGEDLQAVAEYFNWIDTAAEKVTNSIATQQAEWTILSKSLQGVNEESEEFIRVRDKFIEQNPNYFAGMEKEEIKVNDLTQAIAEYNRFLAQSLQVKIAELALSEKTQQIADLATVRAKRNLNAHKREIELVELLSDTKEGLALQDPVLVNLFDKSIENMVSTLRESGHFFKQVGKENWKKLFDPNLINWSNLIKTWEAGSKEEMQELTKSLFAPLSEYEDIDIEMIDRLTEALMADLEFMNEDITDLTAKIYELFGIKFDPQGGGDNNIANIENWKMLENQIESINKTFTTFWLSSQEGARTWKRFGDVMVAQIEKIVATFLANLATFKLMNFLLSGPMSGIKGASKFLGELKMPTLFGIFHQGGEVQGYNTGGLIPQYHSGGNVDNVPIMAQEGEFVMRRSAVDSIGLENLNRMNRTGQASGGANITFTGNIMSDSFIEEEAIPKIKDALRRGADLGIS